MSKYMLFPVVVCTHQSDGAPAFHVCTPQVTQEQIDNGDHYDRAIANARDLGYEGGAVAFDLNDPAAGQVHSLAKMVREAVSRKLALDILTLDGGTVLGNEGGDQRVERTWVFKGKHGEEMNHVCVSKDEAALWFVTFAFSFSQNHWLRDVTSGSTVDGYLEWQESKLRELRSNLQKRAVKTQRIQCINDDKLFWSSADGWVGMDSADTFSERDKQTLSLPIDGRWVEIAVGEAAGGDAA